MICRPPRMPQLPLPDRMVLICLDCGHKKTVMSDCIIMGQKCPECGSGNMVAKREPCIPIPFNIDLSGWMLKKGTSMISTVKEKRRFPVPLPLSTTVCFSSTEFDQFISLRRRTPAFAAIGK